ncbi:unnamed protein product [Dicrocoelium dendriticum]|nr:unnamed protein product [Dicrocoelium dendriticum]
MRLGSTEAQFTQELELANHVKSCGQMELRVSKANLTTEIDSLRLETHHTPKAPMFSVPQCAVEGNALHLVWHSTGSNRDTPPLCDRFLSDYHQMYETVPGSGENGAAKLSVMNIPTTCPSRSDSSMNVNVNSVSSCRPKQNVGRLNGHLPASVSAYLLSSPGVPDKISNGLVVTTVSPRKPRLHGSFTSISGHTTNSRSGEWHNCALEETGASRPVYKELEPVTYSLEVDDGRGGPFKVSGVMTQMLSARTFHPCVTAN